MIRRISTSITTLAALGLIACSSAPPDTDDSPGKPGVRAVPTEIEVADSLDTGKKDKVDWKLVTADSTGIGTLKVTIGDPFKGAHGLTGSVGVFPRTGPPAIQSRAIVPDENTYTLSFDVEEDVQYLVQVAATKGKAKYKLIFEVEEEEKDPCEDVSCGTNEECQDGECVRVAPLTCEPECMRGRVCVDGECVKPCGGACPRGQICHLKSNECVKNPCYGKKCGPGQKCRNGRCYTPKPRGCVPKCESGYTCKGTTCVKTAADEPPPEKLGPIGGKIVQLIPQGSKTVLVLNVGKAKGVKVGQTGSIKGVKGTFKIIEVYQYRSKASIKKDDKSIPASARVTIRR